jgi:sugar phosphate isomerase/epimerase
VRLGYNTNGLQNHRLDDALRLLADHGYAAVALTPDVCHLDPYRSTPAEVEAIGALLARLRLRVVIETGARFVLDPTCKHAPTLMARDPQARAKRLDYYSRCAALGRDLGAEVVSFWAGVDPAPTTDSFAWLCEGVAATVSLVRAMGLRPALEPEPGMAIETCAQYTALVDALGAEAPELCLDVGHLYVTREGSAAAIIAALGARLAQVHLEDMRLGVHEHLPPGEGDVDFAAVATALDAVGYAGNVCFELSRSSHAAPDMLRRCRETWLAAVRA